MHGTRMVDCHLLPLSAPPHGSTKPDHIHGKRPGASNHVCTTGHPALRLLAGSAYGMLFVHEWESIAGRTRGQLRKAKLLYQ